MEARAHLGYMPENVPLYTDMRVSEYLVYRAKLKGVTGRRLKERVGDVKELCGLADVIQCKHSGAQIFQLQREAGERTNGSC